MPLLHLSNLIDTKAISDLASEKHDGVRYLITRFPSLVGRDHYFQWLPEVAPSPKLLKSWKNRKITWKGFSDRYVQEMQTIPEAQKRVLELRELIQQGQKITLLCFESEWRHDCHRHILKQIILESEPESKPDAQYNISQAELLSHIPKQKNKENKALLEAEHQKITAELPKHCYYCNIVNYSNKDEYQKHVLLKHPGKLCYLGISDLKLLRIQGQNMPWEI